MRWFFCFILFCLSLPVYALEEKDLLLMEEYELLDSKRRKITEDWKVNPSKLDIDLYKYKDQDRNITDWENLNAYEWLDFKNWERERNLKDQDMEWRKKYRSLSNLEVMGRVLKCIGVCRKFHGRSPVNARYLSVIKEGDEILTEKDSYAWVVLVDGSLVKVAPKTSLTFHEINIAPKEIFVLLRLNNGHINYLQRGSEKLQALDRPETDLSMYPLLLTQANREYYMLKEYQEKGEVQRLEYAVEENPGHKGQYARLNELIMQNNKLIADKKSRWFIFTPNVSLEGVNSDVDLFYEPNGKAYFRYDKSIGAGDKFQTVSQQNITYRGHTATENFVPQLANWYQMDVNGELISPLEEQLSELNVNKSMLKRIPGILLARELWIDKYSKGIYQNNLTQKEFAENIGYRLWNYSQSDELEQRVSYIRNYIRRVETTNLKSLKVLYYKRKKHGFTKEFYTKAFKKHFIALKKRYQQDKLMIREMNITNFYVWVLRHGTNKI